MFFFSVLSLIKKREQTTNSKWKTIPTFVKKLYKAMRNYKTLCLKLVRVPAPSHKEDKLFVEFYPFVALYMSRAIRSFFLRN